MDSAGNGHQHQAAHHRNNGNDAIAISLPTEEHFEKLQRYVASTSSELRVIEDALEESVAEVWDAFSDVVAIRYEAHEQCETFELVRTDNAFIGKVIMALSALSAEYVALRKEAEARFYGPLACFGERFEDGEIPEGDESANIASIMPLLEDLSVFVKRSHAAIANGIAQLSGMYSDNKSSKGYRETFRGARVISFLFDMGGLLRTLMTLDGIVCSNIELQVPNLTILCLSLDDDLLLP